MKRIILHIDVNNAFLSWTAIDRLRNGEKIDIRDRYAVIGGDEEARRGVVLAKSNLCKARGVVTGESLYLARRKCPYLEVYSANHSIYKEFSNQMYEYLLQYTNIVERYSIDECFLDYTYSIQLFGDPIKVAYNIKDNIKKKFGFNIKEVGIDSGYDTIDIKKYLHDNNIYGVIAYRRYAKAETTVRKNRFKYIKESDCYICPETGAILEYTGRIDRNGYKYYSSKENCDNCPQKKGCCNKNEYRTITRHIYEELNEEMRERRLSDKGKELYKLRKEKIERSFADSKNNHAYRYAMYRGIEKNQNYTWLICAAQNMKNIALKKEKVWA